MALRRDIAKLVVSFDIHIVCLCVVHTPIMHVYVSTVLLKIAAVILEV